MTLRVRTARNDVKSVEVVYESKYKIAKEQKKVPLKKAYTTELFDWYEITLDLEDTRLAYVFLISDGKDAFYYCEEGLSKEYDFENGYYNFFQYPYINSADIVKPLEWMQTAVFYQIFVDRFNRGIKDKDDSYINLKIGEEPTPKCFYGGDLPGITEKLEYLKSLGITAIYLTPIFESPSNHKYDIVDYYNIDPHFGTAEDLRTLVKKAHSLGMKIVLDAVFNHVSTRGKLFMDVVEKGRKSEYYDFFVIRGDKPDEKKGNYEQFATVKYMAKVNTSNPKAQRYFIDVATHYIKEFDIDGWRLDVSDEISQDFWRHFRDEVKAVKSDACIIGENWHDAYRNLRGDQFDSIMNYAFTKAALDFFVEGALDAQGLAYRLNELTLRNKDGVNRMMLNLLDSHDTHRFFTRIKEDKRLMKQALALLFFYCGTPCIYYGTEVLTVGGYDPGCRRAMDFDTAGPEGKFGDIFKLIKTLSDFKKKELPTNGTFSYTCEDGLFVASCSADGHVYKLILNHSDKKAKYEGTSLAPESFAITKDKGAVLYED